MTSLISSDQLEQLSLEQLHRLPNFSAGPASIPTPVLYQAQQELLDWQGKGVSVMEMSHRSQDYMQIASQAEQNLRELMAIPNHYKVLFLQGGASLQFSAIPLNLLSFNQDDSVADYLLTGTWSKKAFSEATRYANLGLGRVNLVADGRGLNYQSVPDRHTWQTTDNASYFHYCANETIHGIQLFEPPKVSAPLVADMSSSILSHPIDVNDYGVIYAGAQKNIGPAGLVIVIIREDLLGHASDWCPALLNYQTQVDADSMSNTPATYSWYLAGLVFEWLKAQGGVEQIAKINQQKAKLLYDAIDGSDFYHNGIDAQYRSIMNVPFTLADAMLDNVFLAKAKQQGLLNLKGHRSVGGMRASIYNAIGLDWVEQLVAFMQDFEKQHG